ncbi:hypothetical protein J2853_006646 [Streptosporangium lutulentum]|uniref:Uncharacterized protein n=1 Tax=Streptosporangium lutulentum TaxID=1461250 RepID=A0ABT9QL15_9ACTN|nr:hypothetical protein [Streptosporangium lutulentum]
MTRGSGRIGESGIASLAALAARQVSAITLGFAAKAHCHPAQFRGAGSGRADVSPPAVRRSRPATDAPEGSSGNPRSSARLTSFHATGAGSPAWATGRRARLFFVDLLSTGVVDDRASRQVNSRRIDVNEFLQRRRTPPPSGARNEAQPEGGRDDVPPRHGVTLDPKKSAPPTLAPDDRVIALPGRRSRRVPACSCPRSRLPRIPYAQRFPHLTILAGGEQKKRSGKPDDVLSAHTFTECRYT